MEGKNPDSWADVRVELPRLAEERWFMKVKRGYARGWEPVQFVDRVQRYLTLLEWQPGRRRGEPGTRVQADSRAAGTPTRRSAAGRWLRTASAAPFSEELFQALAALLHQHAAEDVDAVVESLQREHVDDTSSRAGAWVPRAEHQLVLTRACTIAAAHMTQGSRVT